MSTQKVSANKKRLSSLGSLDELRSPQLTWLQDTIQRTDAAVPHYRRVLDAAGVRDPGGIERSVGKARRIVDE